MENKTSVDNSGASKNKFIQQLVAIGCIKFGQFVLKSGITSSCYADLREASMYPELFHSMVELVKGFIPEEKHRRDWSTSSDALLVAIVGVPYGVVPLAASVAYSCKLPYYPVRKEVKEYGHKPDTDSYSEFEHIIIEDVMSSGSSIVETIKKLEGKKVTDVIVVVDRQLGGGEKLKAEYPHIRLHSVFKMSDLLNVEGGQLRESS